MFHNTGFTVLAVVISLALIGLCGGAPGQCPPQWTLGNPTPASDDYFGSAVAVSGNRIVAGAHLDDTGAPDSGSVYIFDATTGNLLHSINNPTPAPGDHFGLSLAAGGNQMLVGSFLDDTGGSDAGNAYHYDVTTGSLIRVLNNPIPEDGDKFGSSVSVSEDYLLVGVPYDDTGASDAGCAYLFDAMTGLLLQSFINPDPTAGDEMGSAVAVSGSRILLGAPPDDSTAPNAGSAYLFDAVTGALLHHINNPAPAAGDRFGASVAISGDNVLVGAPYDYFGGAFAAGNAYLFDAGTGSLLQTFSKPGPAAQDYFGWSVAVSGENVIIGSFGDDTGAMNAGRAYLFSSATGLLLQTYNNPSPERAEQFGISVGASGHDIIIGANKDHAAGPYAGSVYLFNCLRPTPSPAPDVTPTPSSSPSPAPTFTPNCAPADGLIYSIDHPFPHDGDNFGRRVSVSGSLILVGAVDAPGGGKAYVFDTTSGGLLRVIDHPPPGGGGDFGWSVALRGSTGVVGARLDSSGASFSGVVYVFDLLTGILLHTLYNPEPDDPDQMGYSVSVSESHVIAGAPYSRHQSMAEVGAAYLFDAATGNLLHSLQNPEPYSGNWFGESVAISGALAIVSSRGDTNVSNDKGSAFIFDANTGQLVREIPNPDPAGNHFALRSVAVSGSRALLASYSAGFLFDTGTGAWLMTCIAPLWAPGDNFGASSSMTADRILIGDNSNDYPTTNAGMAYLFDAVTGDLIQRYENPRSGAGEAFGTSVSLDGDFVLVGAPGQESGSEIGRAFLFDVRVLDVCTSPTLTPSPTVTPSPTATPHPPTPTPTADCDWEVPLHFIHNPSPAPGVQDELFGESVAISGARLLIGAGGDTDGAFDTGIAYGTLEEWFCEAEVGIGVAIGGRERRIRAVRVRGAA